jgi:hypothetical protein
MDKMVETFMTKLSKVAPASVGRSEHSNESGYLFQQKRMQSQIEQYTIRESWRQYHNDLGEAYMYAAANRYGNGVRKEFYDRKNKTEIILNERVVTEDGREVYQNNFARLKRERHSVLVSEAEDAPTRKHETLMVSSDALQRVQPSMPLTQIKVGGMVAKSIEQFSPEDQADIERYTQLELEVAEERMLLERSNIRFQRMQIDQQMNMMQQGALPQPGGAAPGAAQAAPQAMPQQQPGSSSG